MLENENLNEAKKTQLNIGVVTSYIDWEKNQKRVIRGGQVMYDVKGTHKFLYMHELYEHWYKNVLHSNYT